jgi:hypothetical protein
VGGGDGGSGSSGSGAAGGGLRTLLHLEPVLQLGHALGHLLCAG